jgi:carbonic anhydrase
MVHARAPLPALRFMQSHPDPPKTPDEAIEFLRSGNERFVSGKIYDVHPTRNLERVKATASGQKPFAAFLSCADSRVPVEIIFDQG